LATAEGAKNTSACKSRSPSDKPSLITILVFANAIFPIDSLTVGYYFIFDQAINKPAACVMFSAQLYEHTQSVVSPKFYTKCTPLVHQHQDLSSLKTVKNDMPFTRLKT
jgi:hypothetical protein